MFPKALLIGCGRLGGALARGWLSAGVDPTRLIVAESHPTPDAERAKKAGATVIASAGEAAAGSADVVVLAVKPKVWREAIEGLKGRAPGTLVSLMAGVRTADLAGELPDWRIARVMPTTGIGVGKGAAAWFSEADGADQAVEAVLGPVSSLVRLEREEDIDIATAMSGSGQGYVFAFAEALAEAGEAEGLSREVATALARATLVSGSAVMESDERELSALKAEVASPGGTTEAGLNALDAEGMHAAVRAAVEAALAKARELANG